MKSAEEERPMSAVSTDPPRHFGEADNRQVRLSTAQRQACLQAVASEVRHVRRRYDRIQSRLDALQVRCDALLGLGRSFGVREEAMSG